MSKQIFIIEWQDNNNKWKSKEYSNYSMAVKAKNWLLKNGVINVNFAVKLIKNTDQ